MDFSAASVTKKQLDSAGVLHGDGRSNQLSISALRLHSGLVHFNVRLCVLIRFWLHFCIHLECVGANADVFS